MILRYTVEASDFQALVWSIARGGSTAPAAGGRTIGRNIAFWFVLGLIGTIAYNATVGCPPAWVRPAILGFGAAWAIAVALFVVAQVRTRRLSAPREGGIVLGEHILEVAPMGLTESVRNHRNETAWAGVLEIRDTDAHVFLMIDACAGYIIPKRAFVSKSEEQAFLRMVNELRTSSRAVA